MAPLTSTSIETLGQGAKNTMNRHYLRHVEDDARGFQLMLTQPYAVLCSLSTFHPRACCPCGKLIAERYRHAGLCDECLYHPPFALFTLPDGAQLISHPCTYTSSINGDPHREEYWWYETCRACRQGMVSHERGATWSYHSWRSYCNMCACHYRHFRDIYRRCKVLESSPAELVRHYSVEIERLEDLWLNGKTTKALTKQRKSALYALAQDYQRVLLHLEDAAIGLPGWTFEGILSSLETNIERFWQRIQESPCFCPEERLASWQELERRLRFALNNDEELRIAPAALPAQQLFFDFSL